MIAADGVRVLAIGSLAVTILLDRVAFWEIVVVAFVEGTGAALFCGRSARRPARRRAGTPAPGSRGRRDGPAGGGAARRTAARRRALRARPRAPVRRRRALVRVLDPLAARDANAVPGGTRASIVVAALAARRGLPLRLEPAVPADVRVPLRARELHRARRAARGGRHRHGAGAVGRRGRSCSSQSSAPACCSARSLSPLVRRCSRSGRSCCSSSGRGSAARVFLVWPSVYVLTAGHPADGARDSVDRLGRPRLPDRDDARPAARPRGVRAEHRSRC